MLPEINEIEKKHTSVLLNELVDAIKVFDDKKNIIVDCTLWMWWHASKIIERLNAWDIFIWFDADVKNLELAKIRLENISKKNKVEVFFINSNFKNLKKELEKIWIEKITGIYYDLWLSSLHLDEAERWFSFMKNWPLDMRLNKSKGKTAEDIVNSYTASELREIFKILRRATSKQDFKKNYWAKEEVKTKDNFWFEWACLRESKNEIKNFSGNKNRSKWWNRCDWRIFKWCNKITWKMMNNFCYKFSFFGRQSYKTNF